MLRAISRAFHVVRATAGSLGRDEVGTVVMYAAAIPVFAGVVAVGAETGNFYNQKRQMQNAADAGALSASIDKLANSSITSSALNGSANSAVQRNGFTNGVNNVSVIVNSPPTSGPNVGTAGAVEVIVQKSSQSFIFGNVLNTLLGKQAASPFTLTARSVAAQSTYTKTTTTTVPTYSSEGCIVALTPNAEQGINITQFNNFTSDCSIMSNGTAATQDANASIYMGNFNNATLTAGSGISEAAVWTRGSFYSTNNNHVYASPQLVGQTTTLNDPYSSLQAPVPGNCAAVPSPSNNALTVPPGTYCGGLTITGVNNVYFTPGTYYIVNGDLYITGVNNVSCPTCTPSTTSGSTIQGTTFVLTQTTGNNNIGGVKITSENNITLNAPNKAAIDPNTNAAYPYPGVLFYQDRNAPAGTMTSSSKIFTISSINNATLYGAIYFPNNRIDISNLNNFTSPSNGCTVWVGRYVKFSSFNNNHAAGCNTYNTLLPGIPNGTTTQTSTSTVTTSRVVE